MGVTNLWKAIMDVRRAELPFALMMASYFFLVITSFWILKPIKKTLFIQHYDESGLNLLGWFLNAPQAELLAKMLNMVVAFVAVVVFTLLARRFRRQQLTLMFSVFFLCSYLLYQQVLGAPDHLAVWSFYLFGDLYSTLMVATFFAFLNDSLSPDAAKRLYGLIGLGGVTGGVVGTTVVAAFIATLSRSEWLQICFLLGVAIAILAWLAGRLVQSTPKPEPAPPIGKQGSAVLEGARLVVRSRYLLSIVGIVALYEMASTLMDFQFTSIVAHHLDGPDIGAYFSIVYAITNGMSFAVQLFLTSLIMTRLGVGSALLILPVAIMAASTGVLALPILFTGGLLVVVDNGLNYSINQSAKESLYTITSTDEKYKAKAFIDMFVQRFAKACAVILSLGVTALFADYSSIRWLSLATIPIVVLWMMCVRYAGQQFREKERPVGAEARATY